MREVMEFDNPVVESPGFEKEPYEKKNEPIQKPKQQKVKEIVPNDNEPEDGDMIVVPESMAGLDGSPRSSAFTATYARVHNGNTHMNRIDMQHQEALSHLAESRYLVNPDGNFRKYWDIIQVFLLVYVAISVPFRLGFSR